MCGIMGVVANTQVNQLLYDGLQVLQHRGQDAAGMVTADGSVFHMHKGQGMTRDVFRTRDMRNLLGSVGIAHVRYPTAGCASSSAEAQPFYVNSPFGIVLGHNGNLTNTEELKRELFRLDQRHVNTSSDSEVLLNVLAHELHNAARGGLDANAVFAAVGGVNRRCQGAYAVVAMIAGFGMLAFRDPFGIRPLVVGINRDAARPEYVVASESVALDIMGFKLLRDVAPGEAVFVDMDGHFHSRICAERTVLSPCIFEYVYFARPDSLMDGISVYGARLSLGEKLADKIAREWRHLDIDVVIPIPDTSRPSALQMANRLGLPYREGFIKNRYIGRTFIMPGQSMRKKSVRQKLNPMSVEFKGRNVLLVDDSIVRGTTSRQIVQMARDAGANQVFFASASPPVRYPNVYGIDMPTRAELIATGRDDAQISLEIGADALIYQDIADMEDAVRAHNPAIRRFDSSCFTGEYVTGVGMDYLAAVEAERGCVEDVSGGEDTRQLDLNLMAANG
jgi:amidophosphoribosyltransferase